MQAINFRGEGANFREGVSSTELAETEKKRASVESLVQ